MAVPRNRRKRKHQHDSAVSQNARPLKKAKKTKPSVKQYPPNFSPQFWDQLSKIPLTPRALRELDWRNSIQPEQGIEIDIGTPGREEGYSCIARFARHGGLDLRHLRGYPEPSVDVATSTITMSPSGRPRASLEGDENILCTELKPITNENATKPKPDSFDGCRLDDISKNIRDNKHMHELIIPTRHPRAPIAPNFFLEVEREDGDAAVMKREACYDSAYGVRAMHSLQNSGQKVPVYDGNAHTFSSTYHSGTSLLLLYAHHSTLLTVGDRPEYHMTKIKSFDLSNDYKTLVMGATALRNARDLAKRYRDGFIDAANLRARGAGGTQPPKQAQDADRSRTASLIDSGSHDETEADDALQAASSTIISATRFLMVI
ncbi:hypothetical protein GGR55DRAFT_673971 [Xylaria sp. FL0064]|nr:hypothetical protein GGR55DRAFT_673971 [Xylaria sp. FL0064]